MEPRHLLHAGPPAIQQDSRLAQINENRGTSAQGIRPRSAGAEKTDFHGEIPPD
jgi:hypothetical protein